MRISGNAWMLMAVMAVALAVVGISLGMPYTASKLLPIVVGSTVFVVAAIGLATELRRVAGSSPGGPGRAAGECRRYLAHGGVVVAFFGAIYLVGFLVSMPVFVLAYMKWRGTGWPAAAIMAVLTPAIVYAVFELAMGIDLHRGLLFSLLGE